MAEAVRAVGGTCLDIAADAPDPQAAAEVVASAVSTFGSVDIALLNAGQGPDMSMDDVSTDDVSRIMALNYDVVVNWPLGPGPTTCATRPRGTPQVPRLPGCTPDARRPKLTKRSGRRRTQYAPRSTRAVRAEQAKRHAPLAQRTAATAVLVCLVPKDQIVEDPERIGPDQAEEERDAAALPPGF
ncbi:hypothetical protein ACFC01_32960 [Streptomyces mirabilis]|uniref:hypothetical protein n=1 Tax=Streptomyces mirabilis TaxID=68239 RepID=UPI0035E1A2BD